MSLTERVKVPTGINSGVKNAKQQTMLDIFGNPRDTYNSDCQPVSNQSLQKMIVTTDIGPFRVTGLKSATEDLIQIFAEVKAADTALYAALGTAGMLCARLVRGTTTGAISNHAWGTAIDIKINGILDPRGDGLVLAGLVRLAPYFNRHGWFWGAGFGTEDGMHFEVGDDRLRQWHADGTVPARGGPTPAATLRMGDRGPEVRHLQEALNANGAALATDGIFGRGTENAVVAFQHKHGLSTDGVVGPATAAALGL